MAWEFKREEKSSFVTEVPEGKHRLRIKDAQKSVSKSGNDMLVLQFEVSGYDAVIYHYIVFMQDRPEITNRMLTQFFDSFAGIMEGDFDTSHWIGKVGAGFVKHEEYNGNINPKISYFISYEKQGDLPQWKGANDPNVTDGFVPIPADAPDEFPF